MDPVTAVGLASGVVAFVTFSTSLVKGAVKIHEALDGVLDENRNRESIAVEMKRFAARLLAPDDQRLAGEERQLCVLAAECRDLSTKLVELLSRIKPKDTESVSQSLWSALKNKVHDKERANLEERLDYCRSQLDLLLTFINKTSLDVLVESAKSDAAQLERLRKNVEDLRRGFQVAGVSAEAQGQISRLVDVQESAFSVIIQSRIVKSLAFEGMYGRFDMVDEAHCKTFRWILHENDVSDAEDDVDAIRYELGSGKSTLMKYLSDHSGTLAKLREWAGGRDLVVASFFFWRPGSPMQKSLHGLYRSILHDVLKSRPELVQTEFLIPEKDVRAAFTRLVGSTNLVAKHCFCFFIDGLDEYQETAQNDHKEMVNLLTSWTTKSPRDVKVCASSREHNVFMNAFSADKRLRLHELTSFDMEVYAQDKLDGISDEQAIKSVARAITNKAEGIFLWVALVVKQMRDQLENGADADTLIHLVDSLPDELDNLYEYILKSLSKSDRKRAYQTLAIVAPSKRWRLPVSLFAYSFLDNYNHNKTFAERDDFSQKGMCGMTFEERVLLGRKRLNGWCKGLVESASTIYYTHRTIDYTHRSIPEFLERKDISDEMESFLVGYNAVEALSQLHLAESRLGSIHNQGRIALGDISERISPLLVMRKAYSLDQAPFTFLRSLDTWVDTANLPLWREWELRPIYAQICIRLSNEGWTGIGQFNKDPDQRGYPVASGWVPTALHSCTYLFTDHGYPVWWAAQAPIARDRVTMVVLVAYAVFTRQHFEEDVDWSILDALLNLGLLTAKTRTCIMPCPGLPLSGDFNSESYASTATSTTAMPVYGTAGLSVWQHYLISEWFLQQDLTATYTEVSRRDRHIRFGAVVQRFLRQGATTAESRFTVWVPRPDRTRAEFRFWSGPAGGRGAMTPVASCWSRLPPGEPLNNIKTMDAVDSANTATGDEMELGDSWSLRSWIEGLEEIPNKEELLRLVDGEEPSRDDVRSTDDDDPSPVVNSQASGLRTQPTRVWRSRTAYIIVLVLMGPLISLLISVLPIGQMIKDALRSGRD
ncbi:hypothetical protein OQA88_10612 [Cercophora sp. LCS_1]